MKPAGTPMVPVEEALRAVLAATALLPAESVDWARPSEGSWRRTSSPISTNRLSPSR